MADGFSARATACKAAERGQRDQSLMSLDSTLMHQRGSTGTPAPCVRAALFCALYRIFLLDLPYREPGCRCLGLEALAFSALIHSLPPKNQHFSCDLKASRQPVSTKNVQNKSLLPGLVWPTMDSLACLLIACP